ncbi:MAG TPA: multicopper oxidase family protein [Candidatus Binatia bacterium]|nr:multicopper oxidase family protein [Candidatus Binatia bacterium]
MAGTFDHGVSRRRLITGAGVLALGALTGCGVENSSSVPADSDAVRRAEERRRRAGARVHHVDITAGMATVDLGGPLVRTWAYDDAVPGRELRVTAGDVLRARVRNVLPAQTTVHWHGVALRNDMDGVPGLTQAPIDPGGEFIYEFTVPDPGTYFFHPHVGIQTDHGLYAPLVVEDPQEPGSYDVEQLVVLDDWTDGVGEDPDTILRRLLRGGHGMGGMPAMGMGGAPGPQGAGQLFPLGRDTGDVPYPLYVANGRIPTAPDVIRARPGQRMRLRLINAGSDTAFRVGIGDHRMTVTHTDGFPVRPVDVDAPLVAMGERYDVTVTLGDGVFPLVASAEGKQGQALLLLRTGSGAAPRSDVRPRELSGRLLRLSDLQATDDVVLPTGDPDRTLPVRLGGGMMTYRWTINGRTFDDLQPLRLRQGEWARLRFANHTMMYHPMHLHGHTFQVLGPAGRIGPRKDTLIVLPGQTLDADLVADNPGQWATHCHNAYHMAAGMMTVLSYER